MSEPLTPEEVDRLLVANPPSWGPDAYPTGQKIFGFPVIADPSLDPNEVRFVNNDPPTSDA